MLLNSFPPKSGISNTYSPRTIMVGKALYWNKIFKFDFREYVHLHEDRNVTNTLEKRTQGAICIGPTGNLQGNYNFFLLRSGNNITRGKFIEVSTPMIVMK